MEFLEGIKKQTLGYGSQNRSSALHWQGIFCSCQDSVTPTESVFIAADSVERRLSGERSTYEIHLGQQGQGQGMSEADRGRRGVREVTKGQTLHSLEVIGRNLDLF